MSYSCNVCEYYHTRTRHCKNPKTKKKIKLFKIVLFELCPHIYSIRNMDTTCDSFVPILKVVM